MVALATPLFSAKHAPTALTDKYASHVLEALLQRVLPSVKRASMDPPDAGEPSLAECVVGLADALAADGARTLLVAMRDRYATHVFRALLKVLSGEQPPQANSSGSGNNGHYVPPAPDEPPPRVPVPESFTFALGRLCDALNTLDDAEAAESGGGEPHSTLQDLSWHASASPAIQALLTSMPSDALELFTLCGKLLKWPLDADGESVESSHNSALSGKEGVAPPHWTLTHVTMMAKDKTGSRLFEAILKSCRPWWRPLYAHALRGTLDELSHHLTANHIVQTLISHSPNSPSYGLLLKELLPSVSSLITTRPGVILVLAKESVKQGGGGKELMRTIRACLAPGADKEEGGATLAKGVLAVGAQSQQQYTNGQYDGSESSIAIGAIGSRLLQALIQQPGSLAASYRAPPTYRRTRSCICRAIRSARVPSRRY